MYWQPNNHHNEMEGIASAPLTAPDGAEAAFRAGGAERDETGHPVGEYFICGDHRHSGAEPKA